MSPESNGTAIHPDDQLASYISVKGNRNKVRKERTFIWSTQSTKGYSPVVSLLIALGGIILADVIAMILVYRFLYIPYHFLVIMDVIVMTLVIIPLLYIFSLRPLLLEIEKRRQSEIILEARLRLVEYAGSHPLSELLVYTLDEAEALTGSTIGFFHFFDADQGTIQLQAWSTRTRQEMCTVENLQGHHDLVEAGVWADAVRQRTPVIHNDYQNLEIRHGLPTGHALIQREMVIPILRNHHVVAIMGVGNKPKDYTHTDSTNLSTYASFALDVIEHIQAEMAVQKSELKFRTLADWTLDWELWLDTQGEIVYVSPSCERITGYSPEEFNANPMLMTRITHPEDRKMLEEHKSVIHDTSANPITLEYRIIARDGSEHWIEHICRPLFSADGQHLGRRISNRDVTERKNNENQIKEQDYREKILTQSIRSLQTDIARDMHDNLGNQISFLRMNLEYLSEAGWSDPLHVREQLQNMSAAANEAYEMIRAMLAVLQTDNLTDPISLFTNYANRIAERSSFTYAISNQGQPRQLSPQQVRQLFYIFREALGNIEKYAQASHVSCVLAWEDDLLKMTLKDDGVGFIPEMVESNGHYGLKFMRERAESLQATFKVHSQPGEGTSIIVGVPYATVPELAAGLNDIQSLQSVPQPGQSS
jgi:PAS domain S-box-containing protein